MYPQKSAGRELSSQILVFQTGQHLTGIVRKWSEDFEDWVPEAEISYQKGHPRGLLVLFLEPSRKLKFRRGSLVRSRGSLNKRGELRFYLKSRTMQVLNCEPPLRPRGKSRRNSRVVGGYAFMRGRSVWIVLQWPR
jgi:hypothetical protein